MLLCPEVQAKAQAEIDAVIGDDRLPRFEDRERLPYINALVLEVTRWHNVVPTGQYSIYIYLLIRILTTFWRLGIPHCVTEDVVQSGYLIPKGSLIWANIWYGDMDDVKDLV